MDWTRMSLRWFRSLFSSASSAAPEPFPDSWTRMLAEEFPDWAELSPIEQDSLRSLIRAFLKQVRFTGIHGFDVQDRHRVLVAAFACRIILGLEFRWFKELTEVLIYPGDYLWPDQEEPMSGESHEWGVVVLSWEAIEDYLVDPDNEADTATHEFAHALDRLEGGDADGMPPMSAEDRARWKLVLDRHFANLRNGRKKELAVLDDYGAEHESEFFAVSAEAFFNRPIDFRSELPDLYAELKRFYRQDTAARRERFLSGR